MQQRLWLSVGLIAGLGASTHAMAQTSTASASSTTLEEIVITAQRREQTLQETPLAVSVVSGADIAKTGLSNFNDVLQNVPTVQMEYNPQPGNGPTIAIRGIGTDGPNKQSGTALYEDGITSYRLDNYFYDIARVEILRGPQGTLYGGTATGGAVNVITNNPSQKFEGAASLESGNYNLRHIEGMVNIPASDTLSFRLAGNWVKHDQYAGSGGPSAKDALNFRGKALWKPNDTFSLLAGAEYFRDKGLERDAELYSDIKGTLDDTRIVQTGHNNLEVKKFFLNLDVDLGFGKLTYIPALQKASLDQLYTTAATPPVSTNSMPDGKVMTHELRLANEPDSTVTWVAGAYYYDEKSITTVTIDLGPGGQINIIDNVHNRQTAGFGQATIPLSDTWRLTGGARFSEDAIVHPQTSIYPPGVGVTGTTPFEKTYHRLDYLARVEHDLTKQNLLYASISTGYRPGNVSVAGGAYTNETVTAYEVGSKNTLLDGSLTLNGAAFYYKYSGFQLANNVSCGPGCLLFDIVSVPANFVGAELDATFRVTANDTITLQPSYLHGYFTGNTIARSSIAVPAGQGDFVPTDGESVPHAAKWRVNGNYQHDFKLANGSSLFGRGEVAYTSSQYTEFSACEYLTTASPACGATPPGTPATDSPANHTQDAYTIVNLSAGYSAQDDRWGLTAYVRNLTDKTYKIFYNAPAVFVGAPRTYGVTLNAKW